MKWNNVLCILFFWLVAISWTQAQTTFETKVSKTKLGLNERLRVDFEMNRDGDNFQPPSFEGFDVVGGPNQAISNSYINGKRSYSKKYSYFLAPRSKGNFTIGQATIEIDDEMYKTIPVAIEVTNAVSKPKERNSTEIVAAENVHLVAEISKTNPYLNEAITVVYKLYVSRDVSITSSWREINTPKYADFWSQNIDSQGNYKTYEGMYQGEPYRYVILRTTVLYPQKTGDLKIEPLTLDVPIDVPGNRRDLFGRRLMSRTNKIISAGERTISVKPLPTEGRPSDFNGAVGDFDFDVAINKTELNANESLELNVSVSGKGNLKLIELPTLKLPSSLEVYEPERNSNVRTSNSGMSGEISERYTVVPQYKGTYPIRPITFSYFDPKTESYVTKNSEEIVIDVANGPLNSERSTAESTSNAQPVLSEDQFKYIQLEADLEPIQQDRFFKTGLFWSLLAGPFLLIPIFIFIGKKRDRRRADVTGNRLRKADRLAKKYLAEAKRNMNQKAAFYEALERALHNYLRAKLDIETTEMSKERIKILLEEHHISEDQVGEFLNLLKSCEYARYTPASDVAIQQDYKRAVSNVSTIDKQIRYS
jgi:hypothetical protein